MFRFFFILFATLSSILSQKIFPVKDPNNILVTFGSCNKDLEEDDSKHIFHKVSALNPDIWIWLGDAAYVDHRVMPLVFRYAGETKIVNKFNEVKNSPYYVELRNKTPIIGVWDDHDYGINNGGKYFQHKTLTQQIYLDFLDEPEDSPRRKKEGIYESYYIGDKTKIKVILLDVRYFKDEPSLLGGGDILGEQQWEWLEEQLKDNPAKFTLIGSGIQILPNDRLLPECWFSDSRERLINLIKKYKVSGTLLLSGDVHETEMMKHPCRERVGFDLYEFTSSGVNLNYGNLGTYAKRLLSVVYADTFNTDEDRFFEENFGVLRFNFEGERPHLTMEAINKEGKELIKREVDYMRLTFDEGLLDHEAQCVLDMSRYGRFIDKLIESVLLLDPYAILLILFGMFSIFLVLMSIILLHKVFSGLSRLISGKGRKPHQHNQKGKKPKHE